MTRLARVLFALVLIVSLTGSFAGSPSRAAGPSVYFLYGSGSQLGGRRISLRVRLTSAAPVGGARVVLTSEDPSVIQTPATVTVPAGETELSFSVPSSPIATDRHLRVTAQYGGGTKGREILIRAPDLRALHVQSVIRSGGQGKITVCLNGYAPAGGAVVSVFSSNPDALPVPATVTIPAGGSCLSFNVTAASITSEANVRITVRYGGMGLVGETTIRFFNFAITSGVPVTFGGVVTINVCLASGTNPPYSVQFRSSAQFKAAADPLDATFSAVGECHTAHLTDLTGPGTSGGEVRLQVVIGGNVVAQSADILFPPDPPSDAAQSDTAASPTPTSVANRRCDHRANRHAHPGSNRLRSARSLPYRRISLWRKAPLQANGPASHSRI